MLFETERVLVRRFIQDDADYFFQINSHPDVMKYIRPVKNREECDAFLAENIHLYKEDSVVGRFAAIEKQTGSMLGTFSFLYLSGDADFHLGYALLPGAWGKGFATELVLAGVPFFFANTKHPEVFAITDTANEASQRVLLRSGFIKKGEKEEYGKIVELYSASKIAK